MKGGPCDDETPDAGGDFTNAVAHANSVLFGKMGYIDTGQLILRGMSFSTNVMNVLCKQAE